MLMQQLLIIFFHIIVCEYTAVSTPSDYVETVDHIHGRVNTHTDLCVETDSGQVKTMEKATVIVSHKGVSVISFDREWCGPSRWFRLVQTLILLSKEMLGERLRHQ